MKDIYEMRNNIVKYLKKLNLEFADTKILGSIIISIKNDNVRCIGINKTNVEEYLIGLSSNICEKLGYRTFKDCKTMYIAFNSYERFIEVLEKALKNNYDNVVVNGDSSIFEKGDNKFENKEKISLLKSHFIGFLKEMDLQLVNERTNKKTRKHYEYLYSPQIFYKDQDGLLEVYDLLCYLCDKVEKLEKENNELKNGKD